MSPQSENNSPKPRVLYVVSHPIQYQAPMLRHLSEAGDIDIHVVFTRNDSFSNHFDAGFGQTVVWDIPLTDGYSYEFLPACRNSSGPFGAVNERRKQALALLQVFRSFNPDAVWVHGYSSLLALVLLVACKISSTPLLVRADVEESDAHGGPRVRAVKNQLLRWYFPLINGFLAVGIRNAKFYTDRGVPQRKIFMTPYGVDNRRFTPTGEPGAQDGNSQVFIFVGKLIARKRPQDAIEALRHLAVNGTPVPTLVFVGSGELEPQLRALVQTYDLTQHVVFAGFVNQQEIVNYYRAARALLLISERERWGLVANEAMAAACPVISYEAVGCSHDLVRDQETGFVVETGNIGDLAKAMSSLLDPDRHSVMAKAAHEHVSRYSFIEVANGLNKSLRSLGILEPAG